MYLLAGHSPAHISVCAPSGVSKDKWAVDTDLSGPTRTRGRVSVAAGRALALSRARSLLVRVQYLLRGINVTVLVLVIKY